MINYTTYTLALATLTNIPSTDVNFQNIIPDCIDYAEGRIYRELDMLVGNVRDNSAVTTTSRNFILPTSVGTFLVVDGINIITPAGVLAETGVRNPLTPVSRDFLDASYPSPTGSTVPQFFAYLTNNTYLTGGAAQNQVIFGPWPDQIYSVEVIGKIQPQALSAANPNTYLTDRLPDLFVAASMVFMSGYMRNWGSQQDDPRMSSSWETQYQSLKQSAEVWEARKRFAGASWTPKILEPIAQPQRG